MSPNVTPQVRPPRPVMLIGKLSRLTGRSAHTIRWYESQRLIPGVRRDVQGRRLYVQSHIDWLDLLDRLRRSGMTIKQIREFAALVKQGKGTLKEQQQLMKSHRKRIEASIRDLQESLQIIDKKIDYYGTWASTGVRPPSTRMKNGG
jgi:DNA-binding transcriptional MerR regulator